MKKILFNSLLMICLFACHAPKKIQTGSSAIAKDNFDSTGGHLMAKARQLFQAENEIPFETISAKARVNYEDQNGKQPEVNAFIRMKRGQFIWVSVTASFMNFEAARVFITPEKITIINKLDKTIEDHPISFIRQKVSLPLTFDDLQKLIAGKIILSGDSVTNVSSSENFLKISTDNHQGLINDIFFTSQTLLLAKQQLHVSTASQNYTADILYENYEKNDAGFFSILRNISVPGMQQRLQLDFKQYEFNNELSVPFNRPEGYTVK